MSAILTAVTDTVTAATGWMGTFANKVASDNILLLGVVCVPLVGLGVGLLGRLLRKRV